MPPSSVGADVELGFEKPTTLVRFEGEPALTLNAQRQLGSNTLEVTAGLVAVALINKEILNPRGMTLRVAYLESDYIEASIDRVIRPQRRRRRPHRQLADRRHEGRRVLPRLCYSTGFKIIAVSPPSSRWQ